MRSQDTTDLRPVSFPAWMVREIALDLHEKEHLKARLRVSSLELATYKSLTQNLENSMKQQAQQLDLLQKINTSLRLQEAAAAFENSPDNTPLWILRLLAAFGIGYILGSL